MCTNPVNNQLINPSNNQLKNPSNNQLKNTSNNQLKNSSSQLNNLSLQPVTTNLFSNALLKTSIPVKSNQQIMIITDRPSCIKTINNYNVYVYINDNNSSSIFNKCIKYYMLSNVFTANTLQITSQYNGQLIHLPNLKNITMGYAKLFLGADETNVGNYISNSFLTIINTSNKSFNSNSYPSSSIQMNSETGVLTFDVKSLPPKIKHNFYITSINLNNSTNRINKNKRLGPYEKINFIGNPVIIIYVPPYLAQNSNNNDSQDSNDYDIYVNTFYK